MRSVQKNDRILCDDNKNTEIKNSIDRNNIRWSKESELSTPYISTSVPIIHAMSWSGQVRPWAGMAYLPPTDMVKPSKGWMPPLTKTQSNSQSRCDTIKRVNTKFFSESYQSWENFNNFRCRIWIFQKFEKYFTLFFFKLIEKWNKTWNLFWKTFEKNEIDKQRANRDNRSKTKRKNEQRTQTRHQKESKKRRHQMILKSKISQKRKQNFAFCFWQRDEKTQTSKHWND